MHLRHVEKNIANWIRVLGNPAELVRHEQKLTIRGILERGMTIQNMITAGAKRSDITAIVDMQIQCFLASFNVAHTLTQYQLQELAVTLVERYPNETLGDFQLLFRLAKTGAFGPIFNRIDISVICEWMDKYLDHKAFECEQMQREIGKDSKPEPLPAMTPEEKEKFYAEKLELRNRLDQIDKQYRDAKRRGIGFAYEPGREAEYQKFLAEQNEKYKLALKKQIDDVSRRGNLGGNDGGSTGGNVPVPDANGGNDPKPV